MRRSILIALLGLLCLTVTVPVFAEDAGQPVPWLNWSVGAKAIGLGRSHTVVSNEAAAIIQNPADLSFLQNNYLSLMHTQIMQDVTLDYAGVSYHLMGVGLGVAYQGFAVDNIPKTNLDGQIIGTISDRERALDLAASKEVQPGLALGGTARLISQNMDELSGLGCSFNLGVKWVPAEHWTVGLHILNLGGRVYSNFGMEKMPVVMRLGGSYYWEERDLTVIGEYSSDPGEKPVHLGVEKGYMKNLRLRAGLDGLTPTIGIGLVMAKLTVDYAFVLDQDFGKLQYLSLNWQY